jgi:hypothetical protein
LSFAGRRESRAGDEKTKRLNSISPLGYATENKAGDGIRTRDLLLGKETFYRLNYTRNCPILYHKFCAAQAPGDAVIVLGRCNSPYEALRLYRRVLLMRLQLVSWRLGC